MEQVNIFFGIFVYVIEYREVYPVFLCSCCAEFIRFRAIYYRSHNISVAHFSFAIVEYFTCIYTISVFCVGFKSAHGNAMYGSGVFVSEKRIKILGVPVRRNGLHHREQSQPRYRRPVCSHYDCDSGVGEILKIGLTYE